MVPIISKTHPASPITPARQPRPNPQTLAVASLAARCSLQEVLVRRLDRGRPSSLPLRPLLLPKPLTTEASLPQLWLSMRSRRAFEGEPVGEVGVAELKLHGHGWLTVK